MLGGASWDSLTHDGRGEFKGLGIRQESEIAAKDSSSSSSSDPNHYTPWVSGIGGPSGDAGGHYMRLNSGGARFVSSTPCPCTLPSLIGGEISPEGNILATWEGGSKQGGKGGQVVKLAAWFLPPSRQFEILADWGLLDSLPHETVLGVAHAAALAGCGREAWAVWREMRHTGLDEYLFSVATAATACELDSPPSWPRASSFPAISSEKARRLLLDLLTVFAAGGLHVPAWDIYVVLMKGRHSGPLPPLEFIRAWASTQVEVCGSDFIHSTRHAASSTLPSHPRDAASASASAAAASATGAMATGSTSTQAILSSVKKVLTQVRID